VTRLLSRHPLICSGELCISGTRVMVRRVANAFMDGVSIRNLTKFFCTRELTTEEIEACIRYASKPGWRARAKGKRR
jgi:uncharacterized protein (DUF433 family)